MYGNWLIWGDRPQRAWVFIALCAGGLIWAFAGAQPGWVGAILLAVAWAYMMWFTTKYWFDKKAGK